MKAHISEDRIVFWTVFALLIWGHFLALTVFAGGLLYNIIVSLINTVKGPK